MEALNQSLFLLVNAGANANAAVITAAKILAEGVDWCIPILLILSWLRGSLAVKQVMLAAALAGITGLLISYLIGLAWYHPRPFEIGIGRTVLLHAADTSFPSDHLTLIWATSFSFLLRAPTRIAGCVLTVIGLAVAWARIYVGVHFPLDMVGAAMVGMSSAWIILTQEHRLTAPLTAVAVVPYRWLFAGVIRRGWARP